MQESETINDLSTFLEQLAANDEFSGAVLVARNTTPLFKHAYSLASRVFNIPNRLDTKFNLASMNKMFTGVAIAQLAEQGKLTFSDTIEKYLPEYPKAVAEKVTIHQLLTHTSGMGSYWNKRFDATWATLRTVQDFLALFIDDPLAFEPAEQWQYSNAGFIVLGAIIEQVSGQTYFDYVREHIYRPANMVNTDAYEMDHPPANIAIGYTHTGLEGETKPGFRKNNLFLHIVKGGPAGGGYSTVEDLLNFSIALQEHRLLTKEYTDILLTGKVILLEPQKTYTRYAYGFFEETIKGHRIVGHSGGAPGINSRFQMYLDLGYTVVVLSNYDPPAATQVTDWLAERLTQIK
ncbi:MAG TPA: serine hydrolase domain-containing protein [Ktedonobacteraceae bacterium]|nr:serine hydrolase domain-containing protein [Ktedonobacteraceae bacterium]